LGGMGCTPGGAGGLLVACCCYCLPPLAAACSRSFLRCCEGVSIIRVGRLSVRKSFVLVVYLLGNIRLGLCSCRLLLLQPLSAPAAALSAQAAALSAPAAALCSGRLLQPLSLPAAALSALAALCSGRLLLLQPLSAPTATLCSYSHSLLLSPLSLLLPLSAPAAACRRLLKVVSAVL
jgi:hypothetical protein